MTPINEPVVDHQVEVSREDLPSLGSTVLELEHVDNLFELGVTRLTQHLLDLRPLISEMPPIPLRNGVVVG
jgi:hypothetical protein